MRATIMRAPGNVVVTEVDHPKIIEPTDAIIELAAACICGSDLWPYRGYDKAENRAMGHEYVGTVVEVGSDVTEVKPGDFVVGSFCISDNTCEICNAGYQSRCVNGGFVSGTQAEFVRIPPRRRAGRTSHGSRRAGLTAGHLRRARHGLVRGCRRGGGSGQDRRGGG